MASPHKQPKKFKVAKGTHQPCRDAPNSPEESILKDFPNKPPESLTGHAITAWNNAVKQLEDWGILSDVSSHDLEAWAYNVGLSREMAIRINKEGKTITMTNKGGYSYDVKSPLIAIYNEAVKTANSLGSQFGFTPSSMGKISITPKENKEDKATKLLG